jgi:hypothetical protein
MGQRDEPAEEEDHVEELDREVRLRDGCCGGQRGEMGKGGGGVPSDFRRGAISRYAIDRRAKMGAKMRKLFSELKFVPVWSPEWLQWWTRRVSK